MYQVHIHTQKHEYLVLVFFIFISILLMLARYHAAGLDLVSRRLAEANLCYGFFGVIDYVTVLAAILRFLGHPRCL